MSEISDNLQWGPTFPEYVATFRPRIHDAFRRYIAEEENIIDSSGDLIPLSLLETALAVGENMHIIGFQTGDHIFPVLMDTLRKYAAIQSEGIFEYYYGFLCVRHLLRMVCVRSLIKHAFFDHVFSALNPQTPWDSLMGCLSDSTLVFMDLYSDGLIQESDSENPDSAWLAGPLFVDDEALNHSDAQFLIELLWMNRDLLVNLRTEDMLPGLPALMLVLAQQMGQVSYWQFNIDWLRLEDLSYRCYLGCLTDKEDTEHERNILSRILEFGDKLLRDSHVSVVYDTWLLTSIDDANLVVGLYSQILVQHPETPLLCARLVQHWVFCVLKNPNTRRMEFDELVPQIFKTALGVIQQRIDREFEKQMSKHMCEIIRTVTRDTLYQIV